VHGHDLLVEALQKAKHKIAALSQNSIEHRSELAHLRTFRLIALYNVNAGRSCQTCVNRLQTTMSTYDDIWMHSDPWTSSTR
jgi:hypothetical protein